MKVADDRTSREPLTGHTDAIASVACWPDGLWVAAGSGGPANTVRVWEFAKGEVRHVLAGHGGPVNALAFSPDGSRLLSSGADGIRVWDVRSGKELLHLRQVGRLGRRRRDGSRLAPAVIASGDRRGRILLPCPLYSTRWKR